MADRRRHWDEEDELPVYLARPGTTDPVPRHKFGGMFCSVEGAYESKSIDFEALSVGQRSCRGAAKTRSPQGGQPGSEPGPGTPPGHQGIDIRASAGKEVLQNLDDLKKLAENVQQLGDVMLVSHGQNQQATRCRYFAK